MAEAVSQWLEAREDEELSAGLEERRAEWKEKGGRSWAAVERDMERAVSRREKELKATSVEHRSHASRRPRLGQAQEAYKKA